MIGNSARVLLHSLYFHCSTNNVRALLPLKSQIVGFHWRLEGSLLHLCMVALIGIRLLGFMFGWTENHMGLHNWSTCIRSRRKETKKKPQKTSETIGHSLNESNHTASHENFPEKLLGSQNKASEAEGTVPMLRENRPRSTSVQNRIISMWKCKINDLHFKTARLIMIFHVSSANFQVL